MQIVLTLLLAFTGCSKEIARVNVLGVGRLDVSISMPTAGEVHFETDLEYLRASNASPYLGEWALHIETIRDGKPSGTKQTCDPLDVAFSLNSSLSCGSGHQNCTQRASGARISHCTIALEAGSSTLRLGIEPKAQTSIQVKRMELTVMR